MIPDAIDRDILVDAPPEAVWRLVSEPAQMTRWFADRIDLDLRPGADGRVVFEPSERSEGADVRVSVVSVEPPRALAYRWGHPEGESAEDGHATLVEFTLTPEGDGTRVRVVESGISGTDWDEERKRAFVDDHTGGWEQLLGNLREVGAAEVAAR